MTRHNSFNCVADLKELKMFWDEFWN